MADGLEAMQKMRKTTEAAEVLQKLESVIGSILLQVFGSGAGVEAKEKKGRGNWLATGSLANDAFFFSLSYINDMEVCMRVIPWFLFLLCCVVLVLRY